eukprot:1350223-Amphidinium_carterae.1
MAEEKSTLHFNSACPQHHHLTQASHNHHKATPPKKNITTKTRGANSATLKANELCQVWLATDYISIKLLEDTAIAQNMITSTCMTHQKVKPSATTFKS